jgi:RNA polymerase sigma-70 factor (ECF subfamily)
MEEICATQEDFKTALSQLSARDRELLFYKYVLDLSPKGIADIVGINHNHIWKYLTRARHRAYKILTTKGGE